MITIQSGKLNIPEEERFVGFAGDNLTDSKQFLCLDAGAGSFTLCLRFDDDSVRVIPLEKSDTDDGVLLTWRIRSSHLVKSGIVMAQLKSVDSEGVIRHTSCDYFLIANSAESAGGGEVDYVAREEFEERMAAFLGEIRDSAPYIGDDGYWYVYDVESDSYVRSVKATADIVIDELLTDGSTNPVENRAIKNYVDTGLSAKVNRTTLIAGNRIDGGISAASLAESLLGHINPRQVIPDTTVGSGGQYGKTSSGDPVMCMLGSTWVKLATENDLEKIMDLAPDVNSSQIASLPTGQVFICQGCVAVKTDNGYIELAKRTDVYSKSEIDAMIGDVESLLSEV